MNTENDELHGVNQVVPKKRWQRLNQRRPKPGKRANRFREKENSEGAFGVLLPADAVQKAREDYLKQRAPPTSKPEDSAADPNHGSHSESVAPRLNVCEKSSVGMGDVEKETGIPSLMPQTKLPEPGKNFYLVKSEENLLMFFFFSDKVAHLKTLGLSVVMEYVLQTWSQSYHLTKKTNI